MKLQCKTASTESYFLVNRDQYLYLQEQDLFFTQTDRKSKQKTQQTRIRVFWNALQSNGSKLQKDSIASGYFATSFDINVNVNVNVNGGDYYSEVVERLKEHSALKERIRVIYLNPDKNRLIIVSKFYDGYKNIKACQETLCKALGWTCTKGCCNLNRDYPFPLRDLTLYEDMSLWTETEDYKGIEFDDDTAMDYIGTKDRWVSFQLVTEMLDNRADKRLMDVNDGVKDQGSRFKDEDIQELTEEEMQVAADERMKRESMLSDDNIPKTWPFPLNLIERIAPYNFIRPVLLASCFHVVTMLSAFKGSRNVKFIRRDKKGKPIEKVVNQSVSNGMFMVLEAPPSSGKQSFTYLDELFWSEHMKEDAETYEAENEYNDKLSRKGDNKEAPKKPQFKISCLSPKTTFAQLIERVNCNDGRMMKVFTPEMHDLFSSLANGGNAKSISTLFSSFLRMIKDQDLFSVDYKIATAKKGFHVGRINYFICGTPGARYATFKDPEDGLVSRLWLVSLNRDDGSGEPVYDDLTDKDREALLEFQRWTIDSRNAMEAKGEFFRIEGSEFVYDVLKQWEAGVVDQAVQELDTTKQQFVRRAKDDVNAVGCVLYLLFKRYHKDMSERKIRTAVQKIVLWLAELRLLESCLRYEVEDDDKFIAEKPRIDVYAELPQVFLLQNLRDLMIKAKNVREPSKTISDWIQRGKIKRITDEYGVVKYKKLK